MRQHVGEARDAVERRADLVTHIGQEFILGAARGLRLSQGGGEGFGVPLECGDVHPDADQTAVGGWGILDAHPLPPGQFELEGLAIAPLALALDHPGFVETVGEDHVVEQQPLFEQR